MLLGKGAPLSNVLRERWVKAKKRDNNASPVGATGPRPSPRGPAPRLGTQRRQACFVSETKGCSECLSSLGSQKRPGAEGREEGTRLPVCLPARAGRTLGWRPLSPCYHLWSLLVSGKWTKASVGRCEGLSHLGRGEAGVGALRGHEGTGGGGPDMLSRAGGPVAPEDGP